MLRVSSSGISVSLMSLPAQRLPSWATFSSSVIACSSSSARLSTGRAVFCHGRSSGGTAELEVVTKFSLLLGR